MKKLVSLILAAIMLLSLASFAVAEEPISISFVGIKSEVQDVMKELCAEFEVGSEGDLRTFLVVPSLMRMMFKPRLVPLHLFPSRL